MATQQAKDIYRNLRLMFTEGEHIVCVRSQEKDGRMWSGYWNDFKKLAIFIGGENDILGGWDCDAIEATYICTNPCDPAKVTPNNLLEKAAASLKAEDVLYRWNMMIDIDTIKQHGDVATAGERDASFDVALMIVEYLIKQRFPEPMIFTSGNGWHLEYRLPAIPCTAEIQALVERVQRHLRQTFSKDGVCKIDVFREPNRMTRLYGTFNRKGKANGTPYWQSGLMSAPETIRPVGLDVLEQVAMLVPPMAERIPLIHDGTSRIEAWMVEECLDAFVAAGRIDGYTPVGDHTWNLHSCPWEKFHTTDCGQSTTQVTLINGILGYSCLRNWCQSENESGRKHTWSDFRAACDPDRNLYMFPVDDDLDFSGVDILGADDFDLESVEPMQERETTPVPKPVQEPESPMECCTDWLKGYNTMPLGKIVTFDEEPKTEKLERKPEVSHREVKESEEPEESEEAEPEEPEQVRQGVDLSKLKRMAKYENDEGDRWTLMTMCASDVQMTRLNWLWPNRIPAGKITLFTGKPDCGKTLALLDLVARVSSGADWADGEKNEYGARKVLLAASEDDPADTLIPRLAAAGANLNNIHIIWGTAFKAREKAGKKERKVMFDLKRDAKALLQAVREHSDIALLALDPITSYFGEADQNKDKEIRPVMDAIAELCRKSGITVVGLIHSNKRSDVDAVQKVLGASAVAGSARAVWGFSKDPEDKTKFHMALVKGNLAKKRSGMDYAIVEEMVDINGEVVGNPRIAWGAETDADANDILNDERAKNKEGYGDQKVITAKALIRAMLPAMARDVFGAGEKEGISDRTIKTAKAQLQVHSEKIKDGWKWYLPEQWGEVEAKQKEWNKTLKTLEDVEVI